MRTMCGMALVVAGIVALSGCGREVATTPGQQSTVRDPTPSDPTPSDPAAALLAMAPTPPGAHPLDALSGDAFAHPALQPECNPLDVRTRYWTTSMSGGAVVSYLTNHPGPHFRSSGSGTGTTRGVVTSWMATLDPVDAASTRGSQPQVVYSVAPVAHGTGIRVDAEVVPPQANCTTAGGGAELPAPGTP